MSIRPQWWMSLQAFFVPFARKLLQETQTTLLGRLSGRFSVPLLSGKNFNITYLPINESISGVGETLVPHMVLREIVKQSANRALIKKCTCRDGYKCKNHPIELGCMLLGEGSKEIDTGVSRHVSIDEALAHVDKCVESGLIPFVGRFKADDYLWGVKDRGKLLTVCFCCRCCCVIQNSIKYLPDVSKDSVIKLKGLRIETDPESCTACGECVSICFMGARTLKDDRILYNSALCKGCGKCISVCPENAISADVADFEESVAEVTGRIDSLIDYR